MGLEGMDSYDSQEHYEEYLKDLRTGEARKGDEYVPNPVEVLARCRIMRWLKQRKFEPRVIESIMVHESPCFERVQHLVETCGWTAANVAENYSAFLIYEAWHNESNTVPEIEDPSRQVPNGSN